MLGARGIGPDVERGSAGLECGVGLGTSCRAGWDDSQHFLLNHTCREERSGETERRVKKLEVSEGSFTSLKTTKKRRKFGREGNTFVMVSAKTWLKYMTKM